MTFHVPQKVFYTRKSISRFKLHFFEGIKQNSGNVVFSVFCRILHSKILKYERSLESTFKLNLKLYFSTPTSAGISLMNLILSTLTAVRVSAMNLMIQRTSNLPLLKPTTLKAITSLVQNFMP